MKQIAIALLLGLGLCIRASADDFQILYNCPTEFDGAQFSIEEQFNHQYVHRIQPGSEFHLRLTNPRKVNRYDKILKSNDQNHAMEIHEMDNGTQTWATITFFSPLGKIDCFPPLKP